MARRDPVTPEVYAHVRERDGDCVGPRLGMPGSCEGPIELDHIDTGGLSYRGPSTPLNLVSLCRRHHRVKTDRAKHWRFWLRGWALLKEGRDESPRA
jgi:hypothetical protein